MKKKNWIEFDQKNNIDSKEPLVKFLPKISILKQTKGKKGKTITIIKGLGINNESEIKELLKKMKVFFCTGGKLIGKDIQLQGNLINKVRDFLRKEGYKI